MHLEAKTFEAAVIEHVPPIKKERRLHHLAIKVLIRVCLEFIPLCYYNDCMRTIRSFCRRFAENELILVDFDAMVLELLDGLVICNLGIIDVHDSAIRHEHFTHS